MSDTILGRSWDYGDGYLLKFVPVLPEPEFTELSQIHFFDRYEVFRTAWAQSEQDKLNEKALKARLQGRVFLRLGVFHGEQMVGWSIGWQTSELQFYMGMSLILPEHRRAGLYTQMIKRVLEVSKELGFLEVFSRHVASNNPVLIAKMKLGFMIQGMEISAPHGYLVNLIFHHNETFQKLHEMRSGFEPLGFPLIRAD